MKDYQTALMAFGLTLLIWAVICLSAWGISCFFKLLDKLRYLETDLAWHKKERDAYLEVIQKSNQQEKEEDELIEILCQEKTYWKEAFDLVPFSYRKFLEEYFKSPIWEGTMKTVFQEFWEPYCRKMYEHFIQTRNPNSLNIGANWKDILPIKEQGKEGIKEGK